MVNPVHKIRSHVHDIVVELKKCTWPSRQELVESTMVVITSVVLISLYVMMIDWASGYLIKLLTMSW